ncbi:MAG: hypothetical protein GXO26_09000 [Crenarchaeota archaeon]|nr:hypothetical protein [Thermoproteota archaeon]
MKCLRKLEQYCILTHLDVLEICGREVGLSLLACGTPETATTGPGVVICSEDCIIDAVFHRVNLCNIIFLIKRRLICKYFGRHFLHICKIVNQYSRGLEPVEKKDLTVVKCFETILTRGKYPLTSRRLLQALLNSVRMRSTVISKQLTELVAKTQQEQPHNKKKRKNTQKPEKE